jgi:hypothetical protein
MVASNPQEESGFPLPPEAWYRQLFKDSGIPDRGGNNPGKPPQERYILAVIEDAPKVPNRETDFYAWARYQANELRSRQPNFIDWVNLAEELEEMAGLQREKVVGLLRVVLIHLLKWRYSKVHRSERSWNVSIVTARVDVLDILAESETLKNELPVFLAKAYRGARTIAGAEMGLDKHDWQRMFPDHCPWTREQVLDEEFLPAIAPTANGRS